MTKCDFEEKQFEHAANTEFSWSHIDSWASGQVGEGTLGFDVAVGVMPKTFWLRSHLGMEPVFGATPDPNWWPSKRVAINQVEGRLISLFLQYKRPEYLFRTNAKQFHFWNQDYYRFKLTSHQHSILQHLEAQTQKVAKVRYASPAFHTTEELFRHSDCKEVLRHTHFVSPLEIQSTHECYTYTSPQDPGKPNPSGEKVPSGGIHYMLANAHEFAKETSFIKHISELSSKLSGGDLAKPFVDDWYEERIYERYFSYRSEDVKFIHNMAIISSIAGQLGLDWLVLKFK